MIYVKVGILLVLFAASLVGSYIVFRVLESKTEIKSNGVKIGGAMAGFVLMFLGLVYFSIGIDQGHFDNEECLVSQRDGAQIVAQFYNNINDANYEEAWNMLHQNWRKKHDIFTLDKFRSGYRTTQPGSHQNLLIQFMRELHKSGSEQYLVSFDVYDKYPKLESQEKLNSLKVSELRDIITDQPGALREQLLEELNKSFILEKSEHKAIREYWENGTLADLLRPDLVGFLALHYKLEERSGNAWKPSKRVQRHFRKVITVTRMDDKWKIRSIETAQDAPQRFPVPCIHE